MFIQTETTPNPATLKFLPGRTVMTDGTANFASAEVAARSPLAEGLFALGGVSNVFFGTDFISITVGGDGDWGELKPLALGVIMQHFTAGAPLLNDDAAAPAEADDRSDDQAGHDPADEPVIATIKQLLDEKVRPAVAQDGGDIVYHGYRDGVVYLDMLGACSGCPMSTATLKQGVENLLRYYIPEVTEVRPVGM